VFNYLVHNGDAHVKNFSLIRSEDTEEYRLSPAYDLLNTRLHLPTETRTALDLFKEDFTTESYKANAFYAYDDFAVFAGKLGLVETRYRRILQSFVDGKEAVFSLIDRSILLEDCKQLYKEHVEESVRALSYSYGGLR
jgi:serine/threonine-protein kinase HipA